MIIEKDFIMREVQSLVQVLRAIIGLREQRRYDEALDEIGNAYDLFFDEDRKTIRAKDLDGLEQLCTRDGQFFPDLAFSLADIIKEEAEIIEAEGEKEKANKKCRFSLELYQLARAEKDAAVPLDIMNKIERLETKIT